MTSAWTIGITARRRSRRVHWFVDVQALEVTRFETPRTRPENDCHRDRVGPRKLALRGGLSSGAVEEATLTNVHVTSLENLRVTAG